MATINDTKKLAAYNAGSYPSLGNPERFLTAELAKIQLSIGNIIAVMKLMEARMNSDGLS